MANIKSEVLSKFIAASIWADGEYSEVEKYFIKEVAEELELTDLEEKSEKEIQTIESYNEEQLSEYVEIAAKDVDEKYKEFVLYLCLQFLCIDNVLSSDEMINFYEFAEILNVDEEKANVMLDEFVEENEDLVIEEAE